MKFLRKESADLFETEEKASKIDVLRVSFPEFDIEKHGKDFLRFTELTELYLQSDVISQTLLPEEIGQMSKLEKLCVLNFNYQEFPLWILNLKKLKYLTIRGNGICKLPESISELAELQTLRIENCEIDGLPKSICDLTNLRELSLSDNLRLKKIDSECLPKKLKVLNLVGSAVSDENQEMIKKKSPDLKLNVFVN